MCAAVTVTIAMPSDARDLATDASTANAGNHVSCVPMCSVEQKR